MAYSEDYRRRTVEYYREGNSQAKVKEIFKVHPKTLRDWETRMENGNLKPVYPKTRKPRKLPPDELATYLEQNPDAFLGNVLNLLPQSTDTLCKRKYEVDYGNDIITLSLLWE